MRRSTILMTGLLLGVLMVAAQGIGHSAKLDPKPVWEGATLLGPARPAAQLIKATFSYNAQAKKLVFKRGAKTVEMTLGSKSAKINGKTTTLPVAPKVLNGASYVPLKNLVIGLGCEIKSGGPTAWIVCIDTMCIKLEVPAKPE